MQETNADAGAKKEATKKVEKALEEGFAEVRTPSDASKTLDKVEGLELVSKRKISRPRRDHLIRSSKRRRSKLRRMRRRRKSARQRSWRQQLPRLLPRQLTSASRLMRVFVRRVALRPPRNPRKLEKGRDLLRKELISRLKPLDAIDATLFIQINHLPHPKLLDRLISSFSWFMTGGHAWILFIAASALFDKHRAIRACRILPALYLATYTVEIPIKRVLPTQTSVHLDRSRYCRRAQTRQLFFSVGT